MSRALLLRLVSVVAGAVGFYLPLAAVPMFAAQHGAMATAGLANGALLAATASAAGVVVTFLPLAVAPHAAWVSPAALFAQPAMSTLGRWITGRLGDRRGQTRLLLPGVALSLLGMTAMACTASGALVVAGAAVFGTGFGILQNATLTLMYARVPAAEYSTVSAIWNGAYDLGMGAGAMGVGAPAMLTGFSGAFLIVAGAMLPALIMARREASQAQPYHPHAADADLVPASVAA